MGEWMVSMNVIIEVDEFQVVIQVYVVVKLCFSCEWFSGNVVFMCEIMVGVLCYQDVFKVQVMLLFYVDVECFEWWVVEGLIWWVDFIYLMFLIWLFIQVYVDFGLQFFFYMGKLVLDEIDFECVCELIISLIWCSLDVNV